MSILGPNPSPGLHPGAKTFQTFTTKLLTTPNQKSKPKVAAKPAAKATGKKLTQTTLKTTKAPAKRPKPDSGDEDSSGGNSSSFSRTPPSSKKQKKAPPPKKSGGVPLAEVENDSVIVDVPPTKPTSKSSKTATEMYQKLTQLEHIIKRPDTYIGSVEKTDQQMWVYNKTTSQMEYKNITYVPGFYKIFDEIMVNAADNSQREGSGMTFMKVNINRETGEISVENNGKGIPIVIHEKEKIYIPEMIFGHLLAGSNFDDNEKKTVGGRNGYGAKLCNVFSKEFTVECQDAGNGKKYKQTWTDNMQKMQKAKITSSKSADFVRITFKPDYDRFGMPEGIDDDLEALLYRRVYDMAGTVHGVRVYLNGEQIKLRDFKAYCDLYAKSIAAERTAEEGGTPTCTVEIDKDKSHPRWEVAFTVSDGTFQQVSFVNSIATTTGGTHVNYIADQITGSLLKALDKKKKGHSLKQSHLRNHIFIFINCFIENPAFNSQTKEQLTTKVSQFGSKCVLGDAFLKAIAKSDAIENIMDFAQKKADKMLSKSDGSKRARVSNAKLVEANLAGTRRGHECTLILTEGDSAKGLAVSGRAILDPDKIGVFPLRGKLLNVRDASLDQITKNQEIQNIKQFLGLKHKQVYTDTKSLRYGHLMIMTDQDHDGSHIKGLLINFLQVQFPSLLKIPKFLQEFITPIVKVWQGPDPKKPQRLKSFFTQPQYDEWKESHKAELSRWQSKYFKGLGTSSNEDAQVYFTNLDNHLKEFETMKSEEAELFDLVFSKKKADARKEWLGNYIPGTFLDHSTKEITYTDFVSKELILFSMADNLRSIPSVIDGLKPGQRKVLYACFKRNLTKDKKVVELAGYVSEHTAYHHGEASLQQTIIGLAQDFVGSNNINVLEPSGNFGSRLAGGSDAASPRYTFTRLAPFAKKIFSPLDEACLKHQYEDGKRIEPEVYSPILPMVLVNGADGIGTGWSTTIPNYHPADIVKNLKRRMGRLDEDDAEEKPFETMTPWFRGWKGNPEAAGPDRYKFNGIASQNDQNPNEIIITELPIRMWTDDFKAKLEKVISGSDGPTWIKDYKEFNDHKTVHFEIMVDEKHLPKILEEGLLERFKLTKQIATSNLVAFDTRGQIRKYEKVEDILEEYYVHRLQMYHARKQYWLQVYDNDLEKLKNQYRFIKEIIDGELIVGRKKKAVLVSELRDRKYRAFPPGGQKQKTADDEPDESDNENDDDDNQDTAAGAHDYDYLLSERLEKLKDAINKKKDDIEGLSAKSEKDLWCADLDDFMTEWDSQIALEQELQTKIRRMGRRESKKIGAGRNRKGKDDDDYEPEKKSKGKGKSKAAAAKAAPKVKTETKSAQRFADMFSSKTKKEPKDDVVDLSDNFSDDDFAALSRNKPSSTRVTELSQSASQSQSEEPDVPRPTKRAAASKAKTLFEVSSDSEVEDAEMIGDIGSMVKGIGKPAGDKSGRLSLYAMNRPESSQGNNGSSSIQKLKTKASKSSMDIDSHDETNYEMLAKSSPHKIKDEEDAAQDSDDELAVTAAPSTTDSGLVAVKKARAKPAASKAKAKPEAKPRAKAAPKATTLSPAAKAYAAKKKVIGVKKIALEDSEDEVDEVDEPPSPVSKPKPAARGRPGRAAAAKRPIIVDEDSSLMQDESDDPFEMDDD
ncbi:DNA topoisomerase 2 [Metarhizium acridum CQMa 102]|uniref:DNA topoisomerase 2 n=1 Tax=Metarhizium acridum (strain CQMa 102) TaxID=655827 RepID=E9E977_METAQ|nr:DNA topoisomerase 2 [Metarhizium acridum CQMa 102]EFY87581.1 DNA topoisomerase 2 [Metarhizium acridum CQMa 102]